MSTLAQPDVPAGTVIDFLGSTSTSQARRLVCSQSIVKSPHNSLVDCAAALDEPARQARRHAALHTPAFQRLDDIASLFVARQQNRHAGADRARSARDLPNQPTASMKGRLCRFGNPTSEDGRRVASRGSRFSKESETARLSDVRRKTVLLTRSVCLTEGGRQDETTHHWTAPSQ